MCRGLKEKCNSALHRIRLICQTQFYLRYSCKGLGEQFLIGPSQPLKHPFSILFFYRDSFLLVLERCANTAAKDTAQATHTVVKSGFSVMPLCDGTPIGWKRRESSKLRLAEGNWA